MPTTTRGQEAFEQYLQSDEVKENKQKIQEAVDTNRTLNVFHFRIRYGWTTRGPKRCLIYLAIGEPEVLRLGVFSNPLQINQMLFIYEEALCNALNGRITFVRGN